MENRDGDACRQVDAESSTVMGLEHQQNGSDHANVNVRLKIEGQVISIVGTDAIRIKLSWL